MSKQNSPVTSSIKVFWGSLSLLEAALSGLAYKQKIKNKYNIKIKNDPESILKTKTPEFKAKLREICYKIYNKDMDNE